LKDTTLDEFGGNDGKIPDAGTIVKNTIDHPDTLKRTKARKLFAEEFAKFKPDIQKKATLVIYPYSSIKYTIREKGQNVVFKICDIYLLATMEEFRAICRKMCRHFAGEKKSPGDEHLYLRFVEHSETQQRWKEIRLERGRGKLILAPEGDRYDLVKLSKEVVREYIPDGIDIPQLGWSKRRAKWRLGHYDPLYDTIVISKALDSPRVPRYVVKFVLYHEFLHVKFNLLGKNGPMQIHSREFRNEERKYRKYEEAKRFLRKI